MKSIFLIIFSACFALLQAQQYDAKLAQKLGADERGMKNYVLVILKTGTYQTKNKAERDSLFAGHFSNMEKLSHEGKLIIAGPFGQNSLNYRGLFLFDVKTTDEARLLVETDPTVKAGVLTYELLPWYGSAALPVYLETHQKIEKKQ